MSLTEQCRCLKRQGWYLNLELLSLKHVGLNLEPEGRLPNFEFPQVEWQGRQLKQQGRYLKRREWYLSSQGPYLKRFGRYLNRRGRYLKRPGRYPASRSEGSAPWLPGKRLSRRECAVPIGGSARPMKEYPLGFRGGTACGVRQRSADSRDRGGMFPSGCSLSGRDWLPQRYGRRP